MLETEACWAGNNIPVVTWVRAEVSPLPFGLVLPRGAWGRPTFEVTLLCLPAMGGDPVLIKSSSLPEAGLGFCEPTPCREHNKSVSVELFRAKRSKFAQTPRSESCHVSMQEEGAPGQHRVESNTSKIKKNFPKMLRERWEHGFWDKPCYSTGLHHGLFAIVNEQPAI